MCQRWLSPGRCASLGARFQLSSLMVFSYRLLIVPVLFSICWSPLASAFVVSTQSTVISAYSTSKVTSAPFDRKLVMAAQDDAAAFIATDGQGGALVWNPRWIICAAPSQNFMQATLN